MNIVQSACKKLCWLLLAGTLPLTAITQTKAQRPTSVTLSFSEEAAIARKVFPLLSLFQDEHFKKFIQEDSTFRRIRAKQQKQMNEAIRQCKDASCYATFLQWSNEDITAIGNEMVRLYQAKRKFRGIVDSLKKTGVYALYRTEADSTLLRKAWYASAKGINYILDIYIKGQKPQYPKIDAISFEKGDTAFSNQILTASTSLLQNAKGKTVFDLPLQMSVQALKLNGRNEAIRYEPLTSGLNQRPFSKLKKINWNAYKYSMILVPGLGPEDPGVSLDSGGAKRCRDAVELYRKRRAPFIVVSGGHVHPNKTPFCEAVEMKKYLVEKLGVPEGAVFIEPYARHTTTNIRNVSRMIFWLGIPSDRPVLIATDASQNKYINQGMAKTALRDLGYLPYQKIKKLSEKETEFYPVITSLQVNPLDPLDP